MNPDLIYPTPIRIDFFLFHGYYNSSNWRMKFWYFLFLAPVMVTQGCLTTRNSNAINEYRSPIREFDYKPLNNANYRILPGILWLRDGVVEMQFDSLLIGKGRYLNIVSTSTETHFSESEQKLENGQKIYLIQQSTCCVNDEVYNKVFLLKPGEKMSPNKILKTYYAFDAGALTIPTALVFLDFSNANAFSAMYSLWQKYLTESYTFELRSADYKKVFESIEWRERSRLKLIAMYAWYAVTVPVDLVTFPFQALAALPYVSGGGVR